MEAMVVITHIVYSEEKEKREKRKEKREKRKEKREKRKERKKDAQGSDRIPILKA
jgi:hypothetical protein